MTRRGVFVAVAALTLVLACRLQPQAPARRMREPAPAFSLRDHQGNEVALAKLRERGPVVLVFYRGHW